MSQTILVTGGAGFIGSNFIQNALSKTGWNIINLDALTYAGNPMNLAGLDTVYQDRYKMITGTICDQVFLRQLFESHPITGVIHFAAESHVDRSITDPQAFVKTNITGTFNLLEVCRNSWQEKGETQGRFVHVSTDEVYGSLGNTGLFTEKTPYDPSSPYSASKASSDHLVKAYYRTYGLPCIVTNCSNNYGPYQFPEKLIPLMILNSKENKPLPIYGDGKNVRDWLFVLDHCDALLTVFASGKPGETYNIGGNAEHRNIDIAHLICEIMDDRLDRSGSSSSKNLIRFVADRPGHDRRYAIDASKIKNDLGWEPVYSFQQALTSTVDWYLHNMEWVDSVRTGDYQNWIDKQYSALKSV